MEYQEFLGAKAHLGANGGFEPTVMPREMFDFQRELVEWAVRRGRAAIFADCGLGKTLMQLVWAENVRRHTDGRVLIITPLAVSSQTVVESLKFGIESARCMDGHPDLGISVTNYERLHLFRPSDFSGVVLDESSILKSFGGARRMEITEFMKKIQYRLLATATAAPNDYIELGTSSEALGELGYTDMLTRFFKNDQNTIRPTGYRHRGCNVQQLDDRAKWRFKGHAETPFWRWVSSWGRAIRRPSDMGFDDGPFILPPLVENQHTVESRSPAPGRLFSVKAIGLAEQREERRRTISERCERVADLVADTGKPALVWCHLNEEGDILERNIPDATQVSGRDSDDSKEAKFGAFSRGDIRVLVTKPKIGAWGLNFQHCAHVTSFPSHSFEQYYQGVRRCWRFGQKLPVVVDHVTTEGEIDVMENLQRKAKSADRMFSALVSEMRNATTIGSGVSLNQEEDIPSWL